MAQLRLICSKRVILRQKQQMIFIRISDFSLITHRYRPQMTLIVIVSCYLLKKSKSEPKTPGDIFADKRFFIDEPPIKTKMTLCFILSCYLLKKVNIRQKRRVILILINDFSLINH